MIENFFLLYYTSTIRTHAHCGTRERGPYEVIRQKPLRSGGDALSGRRLPRPASIRQVSEGTGISDSYLEQIFFRLRKAGLLAAVRGAGGGFYPARELSKITAGEIVRAMEDGATPVLCVDDPSLCKSRLTACCRTRSLWVRISEEIYRKLDAESLSGLRDRYLASLAAGKGGAE